MQVRLISCGLIYHSSISALIIHTRKRPVNARLIIRIIKACCAVRNGKRRRLCIKVATTSVNEARCAHTCMYTQAAEIAGTRCDRTIKRIVVSFGWQVPIKIGYVLLRVT